MTWIPVIRRRALLVYESRRKWPLIGRCLISLCVIVVGVKWLYLRLRLCWYDWWE